MSRRSSDQSIRSPIAWSVPARFVRWLAVSKLVNPPCLGALRLYQSGDWRRGALSVLCSSLLLLAFPVLATQSLDVERLSTLSNLAHPAPTIVTSGGLQPEAISVIVSAGIRQVIDLRLDDETPDFDESAAVKSAGLGYRGLPIRGAGDLTLENARQLDRLIAEVGTSPTLIHCSSGNRVGALIALRSAWIQGQPVDIATAEGRRWGLKALEPAVRKILSEPSRVSMLMMGRHTLQVYGPGGPAPALKEAALAFSKAGLGNVVVTTGPTTEWKQKAHNDADLIVSGSEAMMSEFLSAFPDLDPTTVTPLYLRPAALLVRPGNPKRIQGIGSVLEPGIRILVVNGSGQAGLWEDVAGRLGDIHSVKALRRNIAAFAGTSGEAKRLWQIDPSIDVWLIWNIWQVSNPDLAELVDIEPQYRIYRDVGVAMTRRGQVESQAQAFVDFLSSAQGAAIFTKWGWATNSENTTH